MDGVIDDYRIVDSELISTGDHDSQDAYAATFLSAVAAMHATEQPGETADLSRLIPAVRDAVDLIARLQDDDGLTWAKPAWRVKYLMDQVEVFWGLREIRPLLREYDPDWAAQVSRMARRLQSGIETMWDPAAGLYAVAVHDGASPQAANPNRAFPDVASQMWVLSTTFVAPSRVRRVLARVEATLPQLHEPLAQWWIGPVPEPVGYWPQVATVYQRAGFSSEAALHFSRIRDARVQSHDAWPFHVGIAGTLLCNGPRPSLR